MWHTAYILVLQRGELCVSRVRTDLQLSSRPLRERHPGWSEVVTPTDSQPSRFLHSIKTCLEVHCWLIKIWWSGQRFSKTWCVWFYLMDSRFRAWTWLCCSLRTEELDFVPSASWSTGVSLIDAAARLIRRSIISGGGQQTWPAGAPIRTKAGHMTGWGCSFRL